MRFINASRSIAAGLAVLCASTPARGQDEPYVRLYEWRTSQAREWLELMRWCRSVGLRDGAATASERIQDLVPRLDEAEEVREALREPTGEADSPTAAVRAQYDGRLAKTRAKVRESAATLARELLDEGRAWEADWVIRRAGGTNEHEAVAEVIERLAPRMAEERRKLRPVVEQARKTMARGARDEFGMRYAFSLPPDHDPTVEYPVFVINHGLGSDGATYVDLLAATPLRETCIVVGPSRERPPRWGDVAIHRADCERILRIVSKMIVQFGGDPTRVFMAGHSWGGALCYAAAAEFPDHFAGIVHVFGNLYPRSVAFRETGGTLPILVLRAEHDRYNERFYDPQRKAAFAELEKAGYTDVTLQHVRGAHHGDAIRGLRESAPWLRAIRGGDLFGAGR